MATAVQKGTWFSLPTDERLSALSADFNTGRYYDARILNQNAGSIDVTGEGYGAILIGNITNLYITSSTGVVYKTSQFNTGVIHDIGLKGIKVGGTGNCTIFKRRQ